MFQSYQLLTQSRSLVPDNAPDELTNDAGDLLIEARTSVRMPAVFLILTGIVSFLTAIQLLSQINSVPTAVEQKIAEVEADPRKPKEQKDQEIDILVMLKETAEERTLFYIYYAANIVCSIIVIVGGICMWRLSGPALPSIGAALNVTVRSRRGLLLPGNANWVLGVGRFKPSGCPLRHGRELRFRRRRSSKR